MFSFDIYLCTLSSTWWLFWAQAWPFIGSQHLQYHKVCVGVWFWNESVSRNVIHSFHKWRHGGARLWDENATQCCHRIQECRSVWLRKYLSRKDYKNTIMLVLEQISLWEYLVDNWHVIIKICNRRCLNFILSIVGIHLFTGELHICRLSYMRIDISLFKLQATNIIWWNSLIMNYIEFYHIGRYVVSV